MSTTLSIQVAASLTYSFTRVKRQVHELVEPLSDDALWRRPFPFGNSIGHLLLHLTGNLSYYIGAQMADTGYVRDRPLEFADTSRRVKSDVLAAFDRAMDLAIATTNAQGEAGWTAPFAGVGVDDIQDRLTMLMRCATHADHHLGQMIYLAKQLALG